MSRSRKHTPMGYSHVSEKKDKRMANRSFRRTNKSRVEFDREPLIMDEVMTRWEMTKDGNRGWYGFEKHKDKEWYRKAMRK